jgi:transposase
MFIRRATIKSRETGEPYYTYRLVESVRTAKGVRQHTVLNLGRHFEVPRPQWGPLAQRIEALLGGQLDLIVDGLDPCWEAMAQQHAARILSRQGEAAEEKEAALAAGAHYQRVDLARLEVIRPRSVGAEHVALAAVQQLGLEVKLAALGFNPHQLAAAMGLIVGRMVYPASELATHQWLQQRSGLGELLGYDFSTLDLNRLYRASDRLLAHRAALEAHLYQQERDLFALAETITLYDLTNTFFEGTASANAKAQRGHSKEKRTDCPLVTLALVLDGSGFPKRSEVFAGNVSEPKTLERMLKGLSATPGADGPTVVLDAGIASEENIAWLRGQGYRYLAVSRERHKEFDAEQATLIREEGSTRIRVQRLVDEASGEVRLYCHSTGREAKEQGIARRFSTRLEAELQHLAEGLHQRRRVKNYEKVLTRIGRLRQRYSRVARYYDIRVEKDEASGNAKTLQWTRITPPEDTLPGVYCLRTNQAQWDEATLWHTYTLLTDLEAVFRSLKSELGLRPIYHHKSARVDGHLFISVLAYHLVHNLRIQLKAQGIHLSWESLRTQLAGQERVTVVLRREDGQIYHIRKATRPEPHQQTLYNALGIPHLPGKTETTLIDPRATVSQDVVTNGGAKILQLTENSE